MNIFWEWNENARLALYTRTQATFYPTFYPTTFPHISFYEKMPVYKKQLGKSALQKQLVAMDRHALSGVRYAPEKMYIIEVQEGECWHCTEVCFSQSVADVLVLTLPNSRYRLVKVWDKLGVRNCKQPVFSLGWHGCMNIFWEWNENARLALYTRTQATFYPTFYPTTFPHISFYEKMPVYKKQLGKSALQKQLVAMDRHALSGVRYAPEKMYIIEVQEGECWHCTEQAHAHLTANLAVV